MLYRLSSGEDLQAKYPDTFELPGRIERESVPAGGLVKLIFNFNDGVERMWVDVLSRAPNGGYFGILNSAPINGALKTGSAVSFRAEHIIEIWLG